MSEKPQSAKIIEVEMGGHPMVETKVLEREAEKTKIVNRREIMIEEQPDGTWLFSVVFFGSRFIDREVAVMRYVKDAGEILKLMLFWLTAQRKEAE